LAIVGAEAHWNEGWVIILTGVGGGTIAFAAVLAVDQWQKRHDAHGTPPAT
jgi:hypothetical protein